MDISKRLLEIALLEEVSHPRGIEYVRADAQRLPELPGAPFDGVICNCALMDVPDLSAVYGQVAKVLRPGGWFIATITHPCFQLPNGRGYHDEGFWRSDNPNGVRGQVGAHH